MGIKPVQGELNVELKPIFMYTENMSEHITAICEVMEAISNENAKKCKPEKRNFGSKEIKL